MLNYSNNNIFEKLETRVKRIKHKEPYLNQEIQIRFFERRRSKLQPSTQYKKRINPNSLTINKDANRIK